MKRSLKYAIPVAAIIAQGADEPADASDLFLKLEPVEGESTTQGYEDQIDVLAWSWAVTNTVDIGSIGGGGGTGKASLSPIKVIKSLDSATPDLITYATAGDHFDEAILTATRPGSKGIEEEYLKLTLTTVLVSKIAHGGKDSENGVSETLNLDYAKVCVEYRKFDAQKSTFGAWQKTCWDRTTNKSF